MKTADRNALWGTLLVIALGAGFAVAGSGGLTAARELPAFAVCVALAFSIQWVVFVPSFLGQTEKYFDLTGGLSYLAVAATGLALSEAIDGRALVLAGMIAVWAIRLGSFLFRRIHKAGKDGRFDELKPSFFRFLGAWTLQGLWITFTLAAALVAITTSHRVDWDLFAWVGTAIWIIGFGIEVVADLQKSRFRADPSNAGKFIDKGLWGRSRHPNYFGEIVLWVGVALVALPTLQGWQWLTLSSPFFVALLLMKVSGVPLLEKRGDEKWGGQADYEAYKKRTPVLIPRLSGS